MSFWCLLGSLFCAVFGLIIFQRHPTHLTSTRARNPDQPCSALVLWYKFFSYLSVYSFFKAYKFINNNYIAYCIFHIVLAYFHLKNSSSSILCLLLHQYNLWDHQAIAVEEVEEEQYDEVTGP